MSDGRGNPAVSFCGAVHPAWGWGTVADRHDTQDEKT